MFTVRGAGAPAEMTLIPHIFQSCFPQCASVVPLMLSSGQALASLAPGRQRRSRKPGPCQCWKNCWPPIACCRAPHSRSCCLLKRFRVSPWCCQPRVVHRCPRALRDLQGRERSLGVTMLMPFIGLPVEGVVLQTLLDVCKPC